MPAVAPVASVSVNMLEPLPGAAILAGENAAVTFVGSPLTDNATAELNPLFPAAVSVIFAGLPIAALALAALDDSVKMGAVTVRPNGEVLVTPPPLAVIVRL